MKMKFIPIIVFLLFLTRTFGQSRNIGFGEITVMELANNGDIWVGSKGEGVGFYRASNQTWEYYNTSNTPTMKNDTVYDIKLALISGLQRSYIGTGNGVSFSQEGVGWDTLSGLSGARIWGVSLRPDSIWALRNTALVNFDSSNVFRQSFASPFAGISCVQHVSPCAGLWAGTFNNGLFFTDNGTNFAFIDTSVPNKKLVDNRVNAIAVDNNCIAKFVGTKGGFSICPTNGPPCQNFTTANSNLPQNDISDVTIGCDGRVWIATRDSGIAVMEGQNFVRVTTANGLPSNKITSIRIDPLTCLAYVGMKDGNLAQVDSAKTVLQVFSGVGAVSQTDYTLHQFPQPAAQQVQFISEREIENGLWILTDLSGRMLLQKKLANTNRFSADISELQNGIYLYQLFSNRNLVKTGKVEVLR